MNHRNTRLLLSLAVLSALAACGGQESKEQKPASAPTEASAVQTTPEAASTASAASQVAVDSNASPEDQELLKRAQGIFKPLPSAEEMQKLRPFTEEQVKLGHQLWYEPRLSKGNTVAATPATTSPPQAWTTCRPAKAIKDSSADATPRPR